jgi:hypothetical protein
MLKIKQKTIENGFKFLVTTIYIGENRSFLLKKICEKLNGNDGWVNNTNRIASKFR